MTHEHELRDGNYVGISRCKHCGEALLPSYKLEVIRVSPQVDSITDGRLKFMDMK